MIKSIIKISIVFSCLIIYSNCKDNKAAPKGGLGVTAPAMSVSGLPQDVDPTCVTSDADFAKWFEGGKATENGFVNPANSVAFHAEGNCSFYAWSDQMFLWLTSQDKKYGSDGFVMESPVFYTVSPNADGSRKLTPYKKGDALDAVTNVNRINTEEGQATDNVLLDKNGNIVFYISMVNDVYVALLNMAKDNPSSVTTFPTTQGALDTIANYAAAKNITLLEKNALAIELKSSWVKLTPAMKKDEFVTITADIPIIDKQNDKQWIVTKQTERVTLALTGLHIVGSAANHPEMIWSTYEHKSCAPRATYQYVNKDKNVVTVAADYGGNWLFNQNPQDTVIANANKAYAQFSGDTITAKLINSDIIKPSNTILVLPWGTAYNATSNQNDKTPAAANSQVISINNSRISKLVGNDVRKNYVFVGSTWTFGGAMPNGKIYNPTTGDTVLKSGVAIGTSLLANSTMETDFQQKQVTLDPTNPKLKVHGCFTCHARTLDPKKDDGLSHIFYDLMNGIEPRATRELKAKAKGAKK